MTHDSYKQLAPLGRGSMMDKYFMYPEMFYLRDAVTRHVDTAKMLGVLHSTISLVAK